MDTKKIGVMAILAASTMWAIEPIFVKLACRQSDFLQISTTRAIVVSLIALLYVFATNKGNLRLTRAQAPKMLYIALMGTVVADLLYVFSLTKIPVLNAVLIGHMQPIFIVLFGFVVMKEDKLTRFDYLGIFIMTIAGLLVTTKTTANFAAVRLGTAGDVYVLLATVVWATTAIVMRKYLRELNAGVLVFYRFSIGAVVFVVYLLAKSAFAVSSIHEILVGVVVGIGSILYYESLKRIKAAQVSALELSTPFFAGLLGFLVLKETATPMQILGITLLVVGVHFLSRQEEAYF